MKYINYYFVILYLISPQSDEFIKIFILCLMEMHYQIKLRFMSEIRKCPELTVFK